MTIHKSEHILVLEENPTGSDFIIGDVHGNVNCLDSVLAAIARNKKATIIPNPDRLFIVGDLTDRGGDSIRVIRHIKKNNSHPENPTIYVTRGNHEVMSLQTINSIGSMLSLEIMGNLMQLAAKLKSTRKSLAKNDYSKEKDQLRCLIKAILVENADVANHCKKNNGGQWLVDLYVDELLKTRITYVDGQIVYTYKSKIKMIHEFFSNLPYITHVRALNSAAGPFNIVHADMPFSDAALQERIHSGDGLTEQEVNHATWAREKKIDGNITQAIPDVGRNADSIITYCGHSIVKDASQVIRRATNTVDIDLGSYSTDVALLVNHTKQTAVLVTTEASKNNVPSELKKLPDIVTQHLFDNTLIYQRRKLLAATDNTQIQSLGKLQGNELSLALKVLPLLASAIVECKTGKDIHELISAYAAMHGLAFAYVLKLLVSEKKISDRDKLRLAAYIQERNDHSFARFNLLLFKMPSNNPQQQFQLEILGITTKNEHIDVNFFKHLFK